MNESLDGEQVNQFNNGVNDCNNFVFFVDNHLAGFMIAPVGGKGEIAGLSNRLTHFCGLNSSALL